MRNRTAFRPLLVAVALMAVFAADFAQAQWVMLARHVVGRVEQMSQQSSQAGGPSYDSAAVMLEAPADKVYAAVLTGVRNNTRGLTITREDGAALVVQFTNGEQIAGIKVSALSDTVSHLLVTSAHSGSQPNAAALVMDSVLRVCRQMNVECAPAKP